MKGQKKIIYSDLYYEPAESLSKSINRKNANAILKLNRQESDSNIKTSRRLKKLRTEYRNKLYRIIGRDGTILYLELKNKTSKMQRSRRLRASNRLLDEIKFNQVKGNQLRETYSNAARRILEFDAIPLKYSPPRNNFLCSPWVTYEAPYASSFWSYAWDHSDETNDPILIRHLDRVTGQIGSSIQTRLSGADNDDYLNADYYTALQVPHVALRTGPLECYLAFEFHSSSYSGEVRDEFGFSDITYNQWARARFRVFDSNGQMDTVESTIFNVIGFEWGDDASWSKMVAKPLDQHWFYFRTSKSFAQGSLLLLEAGIRNVTWFIANDESIKTFDDIDLKLKHIMVRTCWQKPTVLQ